MTSLPNISVARTGAGTCLLCLSVLLAKPALAQRVGENAVTASDDAFGGTIGNERTGIYSAADVRGFSPSAAGNIRLDGMYIDVVGFLNQRLVAGSSVRVGVTALRYPFTAPTGIVDYRIRDASEGLGLSAFAQAGPHGTAVLELDGRAATADGNLSGTAGISFRDAESRPDLGNRSLNSAFAIRWRPLDAVELRPFYVYSRSEDDSIPTIFADSEFIPQSLSYTVQGPAWANSRREQSTAGLIGRAIPFKNVSIRLGAFSSRSRSPESYSVLFRNVSAASIGQQFVVQNPVQSRRSDSGEMRITANVRDGQRQHTFHAMVRGRRSHESFGGGSVHLLNSGPIGTGTDIRQPKPNFSDPGRNEVQQTTGGVAYEGRWSGLGEFGASIQRTRYFKEVGRSNRPSVTTHSNPMLYNASGAIYLTERTIAYAGYTRGLEESSTAPEVADNRGEPIPAMITSQQDFGLRYDLAPGLRGIVGLFRIQKPYFNVDTLNIYRQLGTLRNRGIEFSLAGPIANGLTVVAGAVLTDPQLTGEAVTSGRIGARPVGFSRQTARLNADYRFSSLPSLSFDLNLLVERQTVASARPAAGDKQLELPARTVIDLGVRYRFTVAHLPAALRLQMQNLLGDQGWQVTSAAGFRQGEPRSVSLSLATDF